MAEHEKPEHEKPEHEKPEHEKPEHEKPETVKPKRSREGYVMVELTPEDRKKLEGIRDRLENETGVKIGLAGAMRSLLRRAETTSTPEVAAPVRKIRLPPGSVPPGPAPPLNPKRRTVVDDAAAPADHKSEEAEEE